MLKRAYVTTKKTRPLLLHTAQQKLSEYLGPVRITKGLTAVSTAPPPPPLPVLLFAAVAATVAPICFRRASWHHGCVVNAEKTHARQTQAAPFALIGSLGHPLVS